jgi:hypothetical protein
MQLVQKLYLKSEAIMIGASASIIAMLVMVLTRMP